MLYGTSVHPYSAPHSERTRSTDLVVRVEDELTEEYNGRRNQWHYHSITTVRVAQPHYHRITATLPQSEWHHRITATLPQSV